tara:strand:- start:277 stop:945 length:669 start_codon:yes stop_codon:yes gene_type:complete
MKTAGKLALPLPTLQREFGGFRDLARSSMFGAGISGLLTTLTTGNPLAGLAVAGADVLGSTAIAGGIGKLGKKKVFGKTVNFAGGPAINIREADVPEKIRKDMMAGKVGKDFQDFMSKNTQFAPSVPQTLGQIAGSYGAIMTVEPMFYPQNQNNIVQQQLRQRLGYSQTLTNPQAAQNAIQEITLSNEQSGLGETGRQLTGNLAPGTLYQYPNLAGNPMRGM